MNKFNDPVWIDKRIRDIIPIPVLEFIKPFNFDTVWELGNKKTNGKPYRLFYYNKLRVLKYDSIDINGKDGALKFNLNSLLDLEPRSLVTNIGTTEHVALQYAVFENIHNLSSDRMIHWVPLAGKRPDHGLYGYHEQFFRELAKINNYKINKFYIYKPRNIICCDFSKQNKESFKWDDILYEYIVSNKELNHEYFSNKERR